MAPRRPPLAAVGHTPGHSAFLVTSGKDQLMVSNDTTYVPALLAPHPGMARRLTRSGRSDGGCHAPQTGRPRHRRQDDDLWRTFPVPWRWRVRQGRRRIHLHASRPILITHESNPEHTRRMSRENASNHPGQYSARCLSRPRAGTVAGSDAAVDAPVLDRCTGPRLRSAPRSRRRTMPPLSRSCAILPGGRPTGRCLQSARLHLAQDRRFQNVADLLHQGRWSFSRTTRRPASISASSMSRPAISKKAKRTACRPGETSAQAAAKNVQTLRRPSVPNRQAIEGKAGVYSPASSLTGQMGANRWTKPWRTKCNDRECCFACEPRVARMDLCPRGCVSGHELAAAMPRHGPNRRSYHFSHSWRLSAYKISLPVSQLRWDGTHA